MIEPQNEQENEQLQSEIDEQDQPLVGRSSKVIRQQGDDEESGQMSAIAASALAFSATVSLGSFSIGLDSSTTFSSAMHACSHFNIDSHEIILILLAICPCSALLSSTFVGILNDNKGRRLGLIVGSLLCLLGSILSALSPDIWVFGASRILIGLGIGSIFATSPLYVAEIAPAASRGVMTIFSTGVSFAIGQTCGYATTTLLLSGKLWQTWRLSSSLCGIPSLLLFITSFVLPESPRWLASRGRTEDALHALGAIHGPRRATAILESILDSPQIDVQSSVIDLINIDVRSVLFLASILMLLTPISGVAASQYFLSSFVLSTIPASTSLFVKILGNTSSLAIISGAVICALLADRVGRRPLLCFSSLGTCFSLTTIGFCTYFSLKSSFSSSSLSSSNDSSNEFSSLINNGKMDPLGWFIGINVVISAFSIGIGMMSLPSLIIVEMFHVSIRGAACSIASTFYWIGTAMTIAAFASIRSMPTERASAMWTFSAFAILLFILAITYICETRLLTLENAQRTFRKRCSKSNNL